MFADHDARRCLVAGDELAAEIAEPDSLLAHGKVLLIAGDGAVWQPLGAALPCVERDAYAAASEYGCQTPVRLTLTRVEATDIVFDQPSTGGPGS
jgi:hypothetical protein